MINGLSLPKIVYFTFATMRAVGSKRNRVQFRSSSIKTERLSSEPEYWRFRIFNVFNCNLIVTN